MILGAYSFMIIFEVTGEARVQRGAIPPAYWAIFSGHEVQREENPLISYGLFLPSENVRLGRSASLFRVPIRAEVFLSVCIASLQCSVEHFDSLPEVSQAFRNYLSSDPSWPYRPILHAGFLCDLCIAIDQIVIQILASTVDLRYVADSPTKRLLELLEGIRTRTVIIEIALDIGIAC